MVGIAVVEGNVVITHMHIHRNVKGVRLSSVFRGLIFDISHKNANISTGKLGTCNI